MRSNSFITRVTFAASLVSAIALAQFAHAGPLGGGIAGVGGNLGGAVDGSLGNRGIDMTISTSGAFSRQANLQRVVGSAGRAPLVSDGVQGGASQGAALQGTAQKATVDLSHDSAAMVQPGGIETKSTDAAKASRGLGSVGTMYNAQGSVQR